MTQSVDALGIILNEASEAVVARDWPTVLRLTSAADLLDPGNRVARALRMVAQVSDQVTDQVTEPNTAVEAPPSLPPSLARVEEASLQPPPLTRHLHEHSVPAVLASVAELTPFSAVAFRLIELLDDELASTDEIARVASTDPALTGRIIQAANSAYYRRRARVGTIRDAIMVLGAYEVRKLVIATCVVNGMPAPKVIDHRAFWRFSLATALLSDLIARAEGDLSGEAFTAGVLHNVGLLALDHYCPEGLRETTELVGPLRRRLHDREEMVFGFTDAELGARLAEQWRLPRGVVKAIALHGTRRDEVDGRNRVASALIRARIFARAQGMSDGLEATPSRNPGEGFLPARAQARLNQIGRWEDFLAMIDALLEGRSDHGHPASTRT